MRAKELMSPEVRVARPEDTIEKAAKMMAEMEVGAAGCAGRSAGGNDNRP